MFDLQKPSGRRLLFVTLLIVFAVVVFATRFVLNQLGWVGGDTQTERKPVNVDASSTVEEQQQTIPHTLSKADLDQAQRVAERMLINYLNKDYQHLSAWVAKLQPDVTPSFYDQLKMESETVRPTIDVQRSVYQKKERSHCIEEPEGQVSCMIEALYQITTSKKQTQLLGDSFEIRLGKQNGAWKVEELEMYGSLD